MNSMIQGMLDKLMVVFEATEEKLNEWQGTGNLQFPQLVESVAKKLGLDEKQTRETDPLVRFYVRNNLNWFVTRGAKGGIMRIETKQDKDSAKASKEALKAQMKAAIEAKTTPESNQE